MLVVLFGLSVRRLGGSLLLQAIALGIGVAAPYLVASNWVFQTVTFDQVTEMVAIYFFLCLVVDPRPRYWIYLGITLGISLEVKDTIIGLILGIALAVVLSAPLRKALRSRYPWIGAAVALLIWAPNLGWQVANGFPTLSYVTSHTSATGGVGSYLLGFVVSLFFLIPLWVVGMISLFRTPSLRPIAIACAVPLLLFLVAGKSYYAAPTYAVVLAQGLIAVFRVKRRRLRTGYAVAVVLAAVLDLVVLLPLTTPVTPASQLHAQALDTRNEVFADSVGWNTIPGQLETIYNDLPASERSNAVIVSAYYGVPGAVEFLGNPSRLPPVVSPQLSDWYWLPGDLKAGTALMVDYQPSDVGWMCDGPRLVGHLTVPYHVQGLEQGAPVTFCQLTAPLSTFWTRLRDFS